MSLDKIQIDSKKLFAKKSVYKKRFCAKENWDKFLFPKFVGQFLAFFSGATIRKRQEIQYLQNAEVFI